MSQDQWEFQTSPLLASDFGNSFNLKNHSGQQVVRMADHIYLNKMNYLLNRQELKDKIS